MTYDASITFCFCAQSAWHLTDDLIRWDGDVHRFAHVDVKTPGGQLLGARHDRVGGKPPGVEVRPAGYIDFPVYEEVVLPVTLAVYDAFWKRAFAAIGTPYSVKDIIGFVFGVDLRDLHGVMCSGFALGTAVDAGAMPAGLGPYRQVTNPDGLYLVALALAQDRAPRVGSRGSDSPRSA